MYLDKLSAEVRRRGEEFSLHVFAEVACPVCNHSEELTLRPIEIQPSMPNPGKTRKFISQDVATRRDCKGCGTTGGLAEISYQGLNHWLDKNIRFGQISEFGHMPEGDLDLPKWKPKENRT